AIGGGLAGRSAVNVTDAGGGQTPEQIAGGQTMAQAEPPKPLWQSIGDTIGSAISQGLQPLVQAFQGTAAQPAGMPASMQPTPSDVLTNPPLQTTPTDMSVPQAPAPVTTGGQNPLEGIGQAAGNAIGQVAQYTGESL